jgi:hypothetical protein
VVEARYVPARSAKRGGKVTGSCRRKPATTN